MWTLQFVGQPKIFLVFLNKMPSQIVAQDAWSKPLLPVPVSEKSKTNEDQRYCTKF